MSTEQFAVKSTGPLEPTGGGVSEDRVFVAFISYKHADNAEDGRRWAAWLHELIEGYRVPNDLIKKEQKRGRHLPRLLYPVFRDEWEMRAGGNLGQLIETGLQRSDFLVVLCTPKSATSPWVEREVTRFIELGKGKRIIPVLISGQPNASGAAAPDPRDETTSECLPIPLRTVQSKAGSDATTTAAWLEGATDKLAADLRPDKQPGEGFTNAASYRRLLEQKNTMLPEAQRKTRKELRSHEERYAQQLRNEFLKIISGLIEVDHGELMRRDAEARARRLRRFLALGAVIGLVIAGVAAWALVANYQRQKLLETASLREHAAALAALDDTRWPEAVAHLDRALTYWPENADSAALLWSIMRYGYLAEALVPRWSSGWSGGSRPLWSRDSKLLIVPHEEGDEWEVINADTGVLIHRQPLPPKMTGNPLVRDSAPELLLPVDGKKLALFSIPVVPKSNASPAQGFVPGPVFPLTDDSFFGNMNAQGTRVVVDDSAHRLRIIDLTAEPNAKPAYLENVTAEGPQKTAWHPDGRHLAVVPSVAGNPPVASSPAADPSEQSSSDASVSNATGTPSTASSFSVAIFDSVTQKKVTEFTVPKPSVEFLQYDTSGKYLLFQNLTGMRDPGVSVNPGASPDIEREKGFQVWELEPQPRMVKEGGDGASAYWLLKDLLLVQAPVFHPVLRRRSSDWNYSVENVAREDSHELPSGTYSDFAISQESGAVVFLSENGDLVRCDASPPRLRSHVKGKGHGKDSLELSTDGRWLACLNENEGIQVWNGPVAATDALPPHEIKPPSPQPDGPYQVTDLSPSPDGFLLTRKSTQRVCGQFPAMFRRSPHHAPVAVEAWVDENQHDFRGLELPWNPPKSGDQQMQRLACILAGVRFLPSGEQQNLEFSERCQIWQELESISVKDPVWNETLRWWKEGRP
jgi:hypothetical protein